MRALLGLWYTPFFQRLVMQHSACYYGGMQLSLIRLGCQRFELYVERASSHSSTIDPELTIDLTLLNYGLSGSICDWIDSDLLCALFALHSFSIWKSRQKASTRTADNSYPWKCPLDAHSSLCAEVSPEYPLSLIAFHEILRYLGLKNGVISMVEYTLSKSAPGL